MLSPKSQKSMFEVRVQSHWHPNSLFSLYSIAFHIPEPPNISPCFRPLDHPGLSCIPFLSRDFLDFSLFHHIQPRDSFCGTPPTDRTHFKHFLPDMKCTLLIRGTLTSALFVLPVPWSIFDFRLASGPEMKWNYWKTQTKCHVVSYVYKGNLLYFRGVCGLWSSVKQVLGVANTRGPQIRMCVALGAISGWDI